MLEQGHEAGCSWDEILLGKASPNSNFDRLGGAAKSGAHLGERLVGDQANAPDVQQSAYKAIEPFLAMIDQRYAQQSWWYGDTWSIIDAYLFWIWTRLAEANFDGAQFAQLRAFDARMRERPSVQRTLAREEGFRQQLRAEGFKFS